MSFVWTRLGVLLYMEKRFLSRGLLIGISLAASFFLVLLIGLYCYARSQLIKEYENYLKVEERYLKGCRGEMISVLERLKGRNEYELAKTCIDRGGCWDERCLSTCGRGAHKSSIVRLKDVIVYYRESVSSPMCLMRCLTANRCVFPH